MKRVTPDPRNPSIQNSMTPFTSTLPAEITLLILRKLPSYTGIISVSLASKDLQALVSTFWSNLFQLYFGKPPNTTEVKKEFLYEDNRCRDVYRSTLIPFPPLGSSDRLSFQICQNKLVTHHFCHSLSNISKIEVVELTDIENLNRTLLSTGHDLSLYLGVYQDKIVKRSALKFELWNLTPWKLETSLAAPTIIGPIRANCAGFVLSHPGKFITITDETCITEWDLSTQSIIWSYNPEKFITTAAIDGERVLIGDLQGRISIIDLTTKKQIHSIEAHTKRINSVIVHNQTIYSSSESGDIKRWDLLTLAKKDSHQFPQICHITLYVWDEKLVAKLFDPRGKKSAVVFMDLDLKLTQKWQLLRHQTLTPNSMLASYQGKLIAQTKEGIHICDYTVPEYVLKPLKTKE